MDIDEIANCLQILKIGVDFIGKMVYNNIKEKSE
jgi:hypothetical protein